MDRDTVPVSPLIAPVVRAIFDGKLDRAPRKLRKVDVHVEPFIGGH